MRMCVGVRAVCMYVCASIDMQVCDAATEKVP